MARKGTKKARSVEHEEFIAKCYEGRRSPSSGAADHDAGDVKVGNARVGGILFECKTTGDAEKPAKATLVTRMEKIADEAWASGLEPALALRFYKPDSRLADSKGFIDLIVRRVADDTESYGD
jgi:Holliday junction resolvase